MRQKARARASHQEKLLNTALLKRKLLSLSFLNFTPTQILILPLTDLGQPLWASIFSTVKWEGSDKRELPHTQGEWLGGGGQLREWM